MELQSPLLPGEYYDITIQYSVIVPDDSFTGFGVSDSNDFHLKYWYLTPSVYDGQWELYSNKDLADLYIPPSDINMEISFP